MDLPWTTPSALMAECEKDASFKLLDFYHDNRGNFIDKHVLYCDQFSIIDAKLPKEQIYLRMVNQS